MPFTLAHPAASVPLRRFMGRYGVLSALVIGSLTPDFWYFQSFGLLREHTHSLHGLLWFGIPVGLCLYVVFHAFLKRPILALLPPAVAERLASFTPMDGVLPKVPWTAVIASMLVGGMTHLAWDAFTHYDSVVSDALPWLRESLWTRGEYELLGYALLQHLSSVIGLLLLGWWTVRAVWRAPAKGLDLPVRLSSKQRWLVLLMLALLTAWTTAAWLPDAQDVEGGIAAVRLAYRLALVGAGAGLGGAVLAYSVCWHFWARRAPLRNT